MTLPLRIELTCPACRTEFHTEGFASTSIDGKRTDFHPISPGASALPLFVHTCPECGFTSDEDGFKDGEPVDPELAQRIRSELGPLVQGKEAPDASTRYEFHAKIFQWQGGRPNAVADAYLRAAWCAVEEKNREKEMKYRRMAIDHFEKALETDDALPEPNRVIFTYLVGELYRRIGDTETAARWFDRVMAAEVPEVVDWVVNLAARQRDDPQDEME